MLGIGRRQEAELKMLRFSLGVTRWFGHVQRRDSGYIGRRMLDIELPGRRTYIDAVKTCR